MENISSIKGGFTLLNLLYTSIVRYCKFFCQNLLIYSLTKVIQKLIDESCLSGFYFPTAKLQNNRTKIQVY